MVSSHLLNRNHFQLVFENAKHICLLRKGYKQILNGSKGAEQSSGWSALCHQAHVGPWPLSILCLHGNLSTPRTRVLSTCTARLTSVREAQTVCTVITTKTWCFGPCWLLRRWCRGSGADSAARAPALPVLTVSLIPSCSQGKAFSCKNVMLLILNLDPRAPLFFKVCTKHSATAETGHLLRGVCCVMEPLSP